jgi:hypothetical protein
VRAAREQTAVDLVLKIHAAARTYASRHLGGLSYGVSASQNDPQNVTLKGLMAEGMLPDKLKTPWGDTSIIVGPNSTAKPLCAGYTCLEIQMPVPPEECVASASDVTYLVATLQDRALAISCSGTTFDVVLR